MPNMMDYLDWRGDLTLEQSPFNEVDNLILSQLVYGNVEYIVPAKWSDASITIREASKRYFSTYSEEQIGQISYVNRISVPLLRKLGQCPRFANAKLSKFEKITDLDRVKQFAAMVVELDDGSIFYAYRGTDNTIVGWKENFNMCISTPIAAQYEALRYLEETVGEGDAPLRLGGHSKGGNLAIYAAMMCRADIKDRILQVYNNDGPGFDAKIIKSAPYQQILDRIVTIIPQSSVVGMLLEHEEAYTIVQSNAPLLMQHEAFSWEVMGNAFVKGESVEKKSELLDMTLKSWLGQLDKMQRQQFVSAVFHVFDAGDIRTFEDLGKAKWAKINEMITALNQSPQYKAILVKMLKLLLREGRKAIMSANKRKAKSKPGDIYFLE
ncbi:Mbeg1-like protein [Paenibacillus sp. CAU 1782]